MAFGRVNPPGLVYKIDLSKIADRENPRMVEAPFNGQYVEPFVIDWGDGTVIQYATASNITHDYASGAGDVITIIMRSTTGHLPLVKFGNAQTSKISAATISIEHFGGETGSGNVSYSNAFAYTENLTYIDTRLACNTKWTNLDTAFRGSGISQDIESFCFDFMTNCQFFSSVFHDCSGLTGSIPQDLFKHNTNVTTFANCFRGCSGLTGSIPADLFKYNTAVMSFASCFYGCSGLTGSIPSGLFDNSISAITFNSTFRNCTGLTYIPPDLFDKCSANQTFIDTFRGCSNAALTEPYVFWKDDGTFDTDKFPVLQSASNCYTDTQSTLKAKVPVAYGGTMTVS